MQSADHTIYRQYSLLTIGSVSSFLEATGLGISFPASPENNALQPGRENRDFCGKNRPQVVI